MEVKTKDPIVQSVMRMIDQRSVVGQKKYGIPLQDDDRTLKAWLIMLQEELMDACNYIEKVISILPDDEE